MLAGVDTSDGVGGIVPAGVAALLGLPYLSYAARIEPDTAAGTVRVQRISATGYDVLEAPMPALIGGTQALGEPRYPSLKGIMAARNKEIVDPIAGRPWPRSRRRSGRPRPRRPLLDSRTPPPRAATEVVRGSADEAAREDRRLPRRAEDHLMGALWVDRRTRPRWRAGQDQRRGGDPGPRPGGPPRAVTSSGSSSRRTLDLPPRNSPRTCRVVLTISDPAAAEHAWSAVAAGHVAALAEAEAPDAILVGAGAGWPRPGRRRVGPDRSRRAGQRDRRHVGRRAAPWSR